MLEKGKGLVLEPETAPDATPASNAPRTIQERYPFVRFIEHTGGTFTAIITVPTGSGKTLLARLKELVTMDDGYEPAPPPAGEPPRNNPKLWAEDGAGGLYVSDATSKPWGTGGSGPASSWKPLEDLILVKGTEAEIDEVLDALDLWYNASPQIEIRANVIDITNTDLFERGISQADGKPLLDNTDSGAFVSALGGNFPSNSSPGFGAGKGAAGLGGVFRLGFIDANFKLDAYLQLLEQEGYLDIVSSPSIVTRNGVPALLESTEEVPFLNPGTIAIGGVQTYTVSNKSIGVKLNVVPFLVGKDTIHLVINAEVSRLGRDFVVGLDSGNNPIVVPGTSKRTATTEVLVRSGQRVVIGGLRISEERKSESRIPILGQIPLIGWLFSNESNDISKTDVYFIIEPIVKPVPTIQKIGDIFDPFAK